MDYNELSFKTLREANSLRLPQFKNRLGGQAHSEPDGSDWLLSQWSNATLGELGEAANIIKKIERGDFGPPQSLALDRAMRELGKELADTATYLDLLAKRAGLDLGQCIVDKFNEVSDRVDADVHITADGTELWFSNR